MCTKNLTPAKAMQQAGLKYVGGGSDYRRVAQRGNRAQKKKKGKKKWEKTKQQSLQQYRHEANRAASKLEAAYAEVRQLEKEKEQLQKAAVAAEQKAEASAQQYRLAAEENVATKSNILATNVKMGAMSKQIHVLKEEVRTLKKENKQLLSNLEDGQRRYTWSHDHTRVLYHWFCGLTFVFSWQVWSTTISDASNDGWHRWGFHRQSTCIDEQNCNHSCWDRQNFAVIPQFNGEGFEVQLQGNLAKQEFNGRNTNTEEVRIPCKRGELLQTDNPQDMWDS